MTKEEAYDAVIYPLMAQILTACKEHKIAMVASFSLDNEEDLHCTSCLVEDDFEPSELLLECHRTLSRHINPPVGMIKTTDADGLITLHAFI